MGVIPARRGRARSRMPAKAERYDLTALGDAAAVAAGNHRHSAWSGR